MADRFIYQPLPKTDQPTFVHIYCPPRFMLLSEAVEVVGKSLHPDEWTGQEQRARDVRYSYLADPSQDDRGGWRVMTTRGYELAGSEEQANELWAIEQPRLESLRASEIAARTRRYEIAYSLRKALNGGWLQSWLFETKLGKLAEIPTHFWASEDALFAFDTGNEQPVRTRPNTIRLNLGHLYTDVVWEGSVVLKSAEVRDFSSPDWRPPDLEDNAAAVEHPAREEALSPTPPVPRVEHDEPEQRRHPGGRPRRFDRDAFYIAIIRLANTPDGLPEDRSELLAYMRQWCAENWAEIPNDNTIRDWIAKIF